MSLRLDLGAGGCRAPGWVHVDRAFDPTTSNPHATPLELVVHDLTKPLPFDDATAELAVAHHVLDLFELSDLEALLAEVFRVLEPGGALRVSLFDVALAAAARDRLDREWFRDRGAISHGLGRGTLDEAFAWMVRQGGARKWVSTPFLFGQVLETAGFKVAHVAIHETTFRKASICDLDSREGESLFIEGHKPQ